MRRSRLTYRSDRRRFMRLNKLTTPPISSSFQSIAVVKLVEGLFRGWLMRKHHTHNAPPKPACQVGPSKHGKSIVATHLTILKDRVRAGARLKRGIKVVL